MLICPKCHKKLRHIGVDYDRPAVVYTCNDCENSFTSPITKATFSTDKLKALGWKPLFDVEEGFGHTLQEVREG